MAPSIGHQCWEMMETRELTLFEFTNQLFS
jgi:hypothetical protein